MGVGDPGAGDDQGDAGAELEVGVLRPFVVPAAAARAAASWSVARTALELSWPTKSSAPSLDSKSQKSPLQTADQSKLVMHLSSSLQQRSSARTAGLPAAQSRLLEQDCCVRRSLAELVSMVARQRDHRLAAVAQPLNLVQDTADLAVRPRDLRAAPQHVNSFLTAGAPRRLDFL